MILNNLSINNPQIHIKVLKKKVRSVGSRLYPLNGTLQKSILSISSVYIELTVYVEIHTRPFLIDKSVCKKLFFQPVDRSQILIL